MLAWADFILYTSHMTSEWNINGNRPPHLEGELTERGQQIYDQQIAQAHITEFLPEPCRDCVPVQAFVIGGLAHKLVQGVITKEDAIKAVVDHTRTCTGPKPDEDWFDATDICPVDAFDERNDSSATGYRV